MRAQSVKAYRQRRGAVIIMVALLMIPLLGIVAFSVDYGFLVLVRTELQTGGDSASLAGVADLVINPGDLLTTDITRTAAAKKSATQFAGFHNSSGKVSSLNVPAANVDVGQYNLVANPPTFVANLSPLNSVRTHVRRDGVDNPTVAVFFAKAVGVSAQKGGTFATAVILRGQPRFLPGSKLIPFAVDDDVFLPALATGSSFTLYSDQGNVRGNFGTIDLGATNNSAPDIARQILFGPNQSDFNSLQSQGFLEADGSLQATSSDPLLGVQADPGLSVALQIRGAFESLIGFERIIPIYSVRHDLGGNVTTYDIVSFAVVTFESVNLTGGNKSVTAKPSYIFDGSAVPVLDPNDLTNVVPGLYLPPTLVE